MNRGFVLPRLAYRHCIDMYTTRRVLIVSHAAGTLAASSTEVSRRLSSTGLFVLGPSMMGTGLDEEAIAADGTGRSSAGSVSSPVCEQVVVGDMQSILPRCS